MQHLLRYVLSCFLLTLTTVSHATVTPTDLRCEYLTNPLGIDMAAPRLSWKLTSTQRSQTQSAYRILAASTAALLKAGKPDLWDSGVVKSSETLHVRYAGKPLGSRKRCWWTVRVWDGKGHASTPSPVAWFETALLKPVDWRAKWIGFPGEVPDDKPTGEPASYYRKPFYLTKRVASARAYVCGLGMYEMSLNGMRVGDHRFGCNQTDYDRRTLKKLIYPFDDQTTNRVLYETFDITPLLMPTNNCAGIVLGNGWYNQRERKVEGWMWYGAPRLICQIEILYQDGSKQTVASDSSWECIRGPIGANSIFVGEEYDARKEVPGWDLQGFGAMRSGSPPTAVVMRAPDGPLHAQMSPPDRTFKPIPCVAASSPKPGVRLYDCGQNIAGWARISVSGPKGATLHLRYIEELGEDYGQVDTYTLRGEGTEVWEPRFTWHGFRTVEISGPMEDVHIGEVMAIPVHTDVKAAGTFSCSNPLLNKIQENYVRTQLNNLHMGVPSDCPHRERLGYTGDGEISAASAILNLDMAAFYTKWIQDIRDVQNKKTGYVSHTAPFGGGGGGPAWGSASVVVPFIMDDFYGDFEQLKKSFSSMRKWVDYLATRTDKDGIVVREEPNGWCLGDWATPDKLVVPPELVNTCFYVRDIQLFEEAALKTQTLFDLDPYRRLVRRSGEALNRRFFDAATNRYSVGRQGANLFPLMFGFVPEDKEQAVRDEFVRNIEVDQKKHLDTGILGTELILEGLSDAGRGDLAYDVATQTTHPSWGYAISKGATTIWESWNGDGSHDHPMYGSVSGWFYKRLGGIRLLGPAFKKIGIKQEMPAGLTWAEARYDSVRGRIESRWDRTPDGTRVRVTIPANTTAEVLVPGTDPKKVSESGKPASRAEGVKLIDRTRDSLVYKLGSGTFDFLTRP